MPSLVVGASRGLGLALTRRLAEAAAVKGDLVLAAARRPSALEELQRSYPGVVQVLELDVTDPASVSSAAAKAKALLAESQRGGLQLLCHTAGLLQDKDRGVIPENQLQKVDPNAMAYSFAVNTIGPLLVLKHFSGLLKSGAAERSAEDSNVPGSKAVFYSARVGSIGDNATGGWYSYRSSKAALNQLVRCASVELRRHSSEVQGAGCG
eukprot:symbB.v1.2.024676.t1/scaffold2350.1/size109873/6